MINLRNARYLRHQPTLNNLVVSPPRNTIYFGEFVCLLYPYSSSLGGFLLWRGFALE